MGAIEARDLAQKQLDAVQEQSLAAQTNAQIAEEHLSGIRVQVEELRKLSASLAKPPLVIERTASQTHPGLHQLINTTSRPIEILAAPDFEEQKVGHNLQLPVVVEEFSSLNLYISNLPYGKKMEGAALFETNLANLRVRFVDKT